MTKDLGGFMQSFAGNLGNQLGQAAGLPVGFMENLLNKKIPGVETGEDPSYGGFGSSTGYDSTGAIKIPDVHKNLGMSKDDYVNGFRSVADFRHIYGPNTKVPNLNIGGKIYSGGLPAEALDNYQDQLFQKALMGFMGRGP